MEGGSHSPREGSPSNGGSYLKAPGEHKDFRLAVPGIRWCPVSAILQESCDQLHHPSNMEGSLQAFCVRMGLLRHSALWTE